MADELTATNDLMEYVKQNPAEGFKARPYYSPLGDCLIFYATDEDCYARRVNELLTVYLSMKTQKVVGCKIKGIRHIIMPSLGSFFKPEERLGSIVLGGMALAKDPDQSSEPSIQDELGEVTRDVPVEMKELEPVGA
jgi:hypothetical protein